MRWRSGVLSIKLRPAKLLAKCLKQLAMMISFWWRGNGDRNDEGRQKLMGESYYGHTKYKYRTVIANTIQMPIPFNASLQPYTCLIAS